MNPDTLTQAFWSASVVFGFLGFIAVVGLVVEWWQRRDLRRIRELERARIDWQARVVESQCFYRQDTN